MILLLGCAFAPVAALPDDAAGARCEDDGGVVRCDFETVVFAAGFAAREVHVQRPVGVAPDAGWPVAMLFQGSLSSAQGMWEGHPDEPFGGLHEAELVRSLLEGGYAVVTPETQLDGATWWQTNVPPESWTWETSEDHRLMLGILAAIDAGSLGPLDPDTLFAAGISSGGYMTSRVGVTYTGRFRALAIQSASWATCGGALCVVPDLPVDHPPTLFLHGEADAIVPMDTMREYAEALDAIGVPTGQVIDPDEGHAWLVEAPDAILGWFEASR